eukprot:scaffold2579_cov356-Prasinococcus_capsulatus_cf.AAC.4
MVPIVEPEILIDGDYSLARGSEIAEQVLKCTIDQLHRHQVLLEGCLIKPQMVIPGADCPMRPTSEEIAAATVRVMKRYVASLALPLLAPAAASAQACIVTTSDAYRQPFLTEVEATTNLNAINLHAAASGYAQWELPTPWPCRAVWEMTPCVGAGAPWRLSFSFGRALQASVLKTWENDDGNAEKAQQIALAVAR